MVTSSNVINVIYDFSLKCHQCEEWTKQQKGTSKNGNFPKKSEEVMRIRSINTKSHYLRKKTARKTKFNFISKKLLTFS